MVIPMLIPAVAMPTAVPIRAGNQPRMRITSGTYPLNPTPTAVMTPKLR